MKLKLIAAAAMFAVAGQASASIANGTGGNGELFLSVFGVGKVFELSTVLLGTSP